jgi:hypothetical protein
VARHDGAEASSGGFLEPKQSGAREKEWGMHTLQGKAKGGLANGAQG